MRWTLCLPCLLWLLGCRTVPAAGDSELTVEKLELTFPSAARGNLELGLKVRGGGLVRQAQWQLLLDGRPLGSGIQLLGHALDEDRPSVVSWRAPLLISQAIRDEGWRTVTIELSGELTVRRKLEERLPFAIRRQLLLRGAPRFSSTQ